jgi:hypothetical protein
MKRTFLLSAALLALATVSSFAAATLMQQIDPPEVNVGDQVVVTLTVQGGTIGDAQLPPVDGLQVNGTSFQIKSMDDNGVLSTSVSLNIALTATRPGNFTIPAFDLRTQEGDLLHVKAMKLHVLGDGTSPSTNNAPASVVPSPATASTPSTNQPVNPNGPVVMPPANTAAIPGNGNTADGSGSTINPPRDKDGGPAKVFMIITAGTTDAYVGQSIPLRIDFFIRMDVNADQNSLPTIKGSDFLMNNFTTRGHGSVGMLEGRQYERDTWITAISAPKSGDFPLSMERDTYWIKSITNNPNDLFGGFFSRHANLAHEAIDSNQLNIHVNALPTEGRPAHFTGAIGQFQVTGSAQPGSVAVGEPVTLNFSVSGEGNFDYVRCPVLPEDPAWKAYVPSSKTTYQDESRTHAVKNFEQAIIPQKNGTLPLPPATFSYFDPSTKKYVTVPIALPTITVTGSPLPLASTPAGGTDSTASATPKPAEFASNRLDLGSPRMSLAPVYRQPWFWIVQGGLVALPLLGVIFLLLWPRSTPDADRAARTLRQRSLQQEEDAMVEAVRQNNAPSFFIAARHAVQLQLATQWNVRPEALTLGEIRSRDPHLAESLEPLFAQADEVIYSGQASSHLDLAEWARKVSDLLQPQTASL